MILVKAFVKKSPEVKLSTWQQGQFLNSSVTLTVSYSAVNSSAEAQVATHVVATPNAGTWEVREIQGYVTSVSRLRETAFLRFQHAPDDLLQWLDKRLISQRSARATMTAILLE